MKNGELVNIKGATYINCCGKKYRISDYSDIKFVDCLKVTLTNKTKSSNNRFIIYSFKILNPEKFKLNKDFLIYTVKDNVMSDRYRNGFVHMLSKDPIGTNYTILSTLIIQEEFDDPFYRIEWVSIGNQKILKEKDNTICQ